jgi:Ca2+-binding RTX toxin-like protein
MTTMIKGTTGNDVMTGTSGNDNFFGWNGNGSLRCLSKKLSGAASGRVSDFAIVGVALGVEADVANRRPVADLA